MPRPRSLSFFAVALALLPATAAHADWGRPVTVAPAAQRASLLGLAAPGDRPALLTARRLGGQRVMHLRTTGARGRLGAPTTVATSTNTFADARLFAVGDDDFVAGWLQIIDGTRRPVVATGPRLADRQVLAPGPRSTQILDLAADRRGDAVVTFWRYHGTGYQVFASYRPAGGRFGTPQSVADGTPSFPVVAIGQDGQALVAWSQRDGVHVAERPAGAGTFGAAMLIPGSERAAGSPGLAAADGRVVVSWVRGRGTGAAVLATERPAAGASFRPPATLSTAGVRVPHWITPSVAIDGDRALVSWVQGSAHTTTHDVGALSVGSDGTWSAPVTRAATAPRHIYEADLLGPAPGRPPLLTLLDSRAGRFGVATATVRDDGSLAATRTARTGGAVGFRPRFAQGARYGWMAAQQISAGDQPGAIVLLRSSS